MTLLVTILALTCLICLSAVLSASETSLFSLSSFTLKTYQNDDNKRKRVIAKLLNRPRDLLVTIMMLNILANILIQNTVSSLFGEVSSWALKVGVPLVITLLFGEVIPKSIAFPNNKFVAYKLTPFISFAFKVVKPVRIVLTKVTGYLSRIMFFFLRKEKPLSIDELTHVIKESEEKKILTFDEKDLIQGYLRLHDSFVKEHMRPRDEVLFFDINKPIEDLINLFSEKQVSRIPVCDSELDNILGIISLKRFFIHKDEIKKNEDLKNYFKKPFFVPDTMKSWALFQRLRMSRENIAIVVDEYGSIEGLITQEDLTESVIGEIADKKDLKQKYTFTAKDELIASSTMPLEELEEIFDVKFENKSNAVTVGGFLTDELGDIPVSGSKIEKNNLFFYILSSDQKRIRRIYIRRVKQTKKKKNK